ncbi:hypothetical protein ACFL26_00535 [Patescibacteria group bacterium]
MPGEFGEGGYRPPSETPEQGREAEKQPELRIEIKRVGPHGIEDESVATAEWHDGKLTLDGAEQLFSPVATAEGILKLDGDNPAAYAKAFQKIRGGTGYYTVEVIKLGEEKGAEEEEPLQPFETPPSP